MSVPQRQPILFDPSTNEPYIPLPSPHDNIRLTPVRLSDADAYVPILNHPVVYPNLYGPPYPYLQEDADWWVGEQLKLYDAVKQHFTGDAESPVKDGYLFDYLPMHAIRELQPDGTQTFIGVADLTRSPYLHVAEPRKTELLAENGAKQLGDPSIVWAFGDYLAPSHHGRGIMTSVIRTLLHSWGIPYMGVRLIQVDVLIPNMGSRRVFEKIGFKVIETTEGGVPTQGKREAEVGQWVLEYVVES